MGRKDSSLGKQTKNRIDFEYLGSKDDHADSRTVTSRDRIRKKICDEVEEFLQAGGHIDHVAQNVTADPPRKPENHYGGRSI